MNSARYLDMLKDKLLSSMQIHETEIFMQDGAPCHKAKIVMKWLSDNKYRVLEWPGNSPDLNPIENSWHICKNKVECHDTGSIPKLQEVVKKVWRQEISKVDCKNLIKSMPDRLQMVIDNKGEMTKY